jgi:DNA polymerase IV
MEREVNHAPPVRKIIHIDMDAFFASVEQRDNPELRGKPVAVGGSSERGVVAAASYEARKFGVRSAMPSTRAKRLCPDLIFVKSRFDAYREASQKIHAIFERYTDLIQPLSLDEAYLDVTHNLKGLATATECAEAIRADIKAETQLTASAGVSYCKFIAKIASDQNKPDGICVIPPSKGPDFVATLPVRKFHGVGPATAAKMERLGLVIGADIRGKSQQWLEAHFGKSGGWYFNISRGIDDRPVNPDRERKSIGSERTFHEDLTTPAQCIEALAPQIVSVCDYARRRETAARTITLKFRTSDFNTLTRARSLHAATTDPAIVAAVIEQLFQSLLPLKMGVRLLGVTLSGLTQDQDESSLPLLDFAGANP